MTAAWVGDVFFLDDFALRQFDDPLYSGTRISYDKQTFVDKIHAFHKVGGYALVDGYAPFCKHVFVPNFVGAKVGALSITAANQSLLRTGYLSRRPEELAVLSRCVTTIVQLAYLRNHPNASHPPHTLSAPRLQLQ
jgi:hypothetical protein